VRVREREGRRAAGSAVSRTGGESETTNGSFIEDHVFNFQNSAKFKLFKTVLLSESTPSFMSESTHQSDTIPLGLRLTQGRSSDEDDDDDGMWFGAAPSRSSYLQAHAADADDAEQHSSALEPRSQRQQPSGDFRDAAPKDAIALSASSATRALDAIVDHDNDHEAGQDAGHSSRSRKRKSALECRSVCARLQRMSESRSRALCSDASV
jgi:hypothetical protein